MQLIINGVRAVLFSDMASGLLHEEIACRLPCRLSESSEFLDLLVHYGIALYKWNGSQSTPTKTPPMHLDDVVDYPRRLTLDMIFDHSENIYDSSLMRRNPVVEGHIKDCLFKLMPDDEASIKLVRAGKENECPSVLQFLSVEQFEARGKEPDVGWNADTVVFEYGRRTTRPLKLSAPMTKRLLQSKCIGKASCQDVCTKRAVREAMTMISN